MYQTTYQQARYFPRSLQTRAKAALCICLRIALSSNSTAFLARLATYVEGSSPCPCARFQNLVQAGRKEK